MKTKFYVIILTLFSVFSYGQSVFFQKNVNHKAKYLEQHLTINNDSLVLVSSKKPIIQVDFLKEDYLKSIDVNSNTAKIDLSILPIGSFIVQARVGKKRIVMYLDKRLDIDESLIDNEVKLSTLLKAKLPKIKKAKKIDKNTKTYYWVVYESNNNFGSSKSMSLEYKDEVQELISRVELELKSEVGKNNSLLVYEVYNKAKFMKKQLRNPKYYKSKHSKVFNAKPYYSTKKQITP
ncbi:hypothetical protein AB9K26_04380 [Psychroserpens sp. XS_ASV72]|uniref:hypothetical protein n=1 Tax=Psychroserpens sp. XS_ASV72 TaxID=3241293 RepID=UPI0035163860